MDVLGLLLKLLWDVVLTKLLKSNKIIPFQPKPQVFFRLELALCWHPVSVVENTLSGELDVEVLL